MFEGVRPRHVGAQVLVVGTHPGVGSDRARGAGAGEVMLWKILLANQRKRQQRAWSRVSLRARMYWVLRRVRSAKVCCARWKNEANMDPKAVGIHGRVCLLLAMGAIYLAFRVVFYRDGDFVTRGLEGEESERA